MAQELTMVLWNFAGAVYLFGSLCVCGGVYLYFPEKCRQPEAQAKCHQYGMTLVEFYDQSQLDAWNSVKTTIFSMQTEPAVEPWIGLIHDGSQNATDTNFRWLDAGVVTFLTWALLEPNELGAALCSRIKDDRFATRSCNVFGFSTLCQTPVSVPRASNVISYLKQQPGTLGSQTESVFKKIQISTMESSVSWLIAAPVSRDVNDVDSCLLACHGIPDCAMVSLEGSSGCTIFRGLQVLSP